MQLTVALYRLSNHIKFHNVPGNILNGKHRIWPKPNTKQKNFLLRKIDTEINNMKLISRPYESEENSGPAYEKMNQEKAKIEFLKKLEKVRSNKNKLENKLMSDHLDPLRNHRLKFLMSQSTRPGNRERGWNDPPEFLHSKDSTASQNKRTILNQRVAHSFDGKLVEKNPDTLAEPPKLSTPPISQINTKKEEEFSQADAANEIDVENLEKKLNESVQLLKDSGTAIRICDDILKRIKIFISSWPKLNQNVKQRMSSLVKNLENKELKDANELHVRLMMDYPSEVSQWMVGIKKLIFELIELEKRKEPHSTNE
ncbi:steroid receptor RNA activator 1 [Brachionus plicatilis]|uniref:Steroid receptor RNA activator 1 n=1 Tax=Brachionus plicatilis TaxID=10195 RepID=A0A3M7T8Z9_BRAPC|nr:steroid receptor RNA activator 1 [Brachionus plicatilis]